MLHVQLAAGAHGHATPDTFHSAQGASWRTSSRRSQLTIAHPPCQHPELVVSDADGDSFARVLQVQARVLPAPQLFYKDRRNQPLPMRVGGGAWNLRDVCLHRGAPLRAFAICSFDNPRFVSTGGPDSVEVRSTCCNCNKRCSSRAEACFACAPHTWTALLRDPAAHASVHACAGTVPGPSAPRNGVLSHRACLHPSSLPPPLDSPLSSAAALQGYMYDQLAKLNEMGCSVPGGNNPTMPEIYYGNTRQEFVGESLQKAIGAARQTFGDTKLDLIFVNLPNKGARRLAASTQLP